MKNIFIPRRLLVHYLCLPNVLDYTSHNPFSQIRIDGHWSSEYLENIWLPTQLNFCVCATMGNWMICFFSLLPHMPHLTDFCDMDLFSCLAFFYAFMFSLIQNHCMYVCLCLNVYLYAYAYAYILYVPHRTRRFINDIARKRSSINNLDYCFYEEKQFSVKTRHCKTGRLLILVPL